MPYFLHFFARTLAYIKKKYYLCSGKGVTRGPRCKPAKRLQRESGGISHQQISVLGFWKSGIQEFQGPKHITNT